MVYSESVRKVGRCVLSLRLGKALQKEDFGQFNKVVLDASLQLFDRLQSLLARFQEHHKCSRDRLVESTGKTIQCLYL